MSDMVELKDRRDGADFDNVILGRRGSSASSVFPEASEPTDRRTVALLSPTKEQAITIRLQPADNRVSASKVFKRGIVSLDANLVVFFLSTGLVETLTSWMSSTSAPDRAWRPGGGAHRIWTRIISDLITTVVLGWTCVLRCEKKKKLHKYIGYDLRTHLRHLWRPVLARSTGSIIEMQIQIF
jgi:hypothetical protein